jgi:tRNA-specific 2-thiouridylase
MERVAIGMSGGVDSSVAALLVKEQGYDAVGVTMRVYGGGHGSAGPVAAGADGLPETHFLGNACYGPDEEKDVEVVRRTCVTLGIPFREMDLREEFALHVLEYFKAEYLSGRTPNPCIRCNQLVKFGLLVSRLAEAGLGVDMFATGHYARCGFDPTLKRFVLRKAVDPPKDQSYFLCMLSQEQLARSMFPLGGMTKEEVRKIARERGLAAHDRAESQDFAGGDYRDLLAEAAPPNDVGGAAAVAPRPAEAASTPRSASRLRGFFKDSEGRILGEHEGIWSYTIGQRRGLGIAAGEPLYVTGMDAETNTVFVGKAAELYKGGLVASRVNWVSVSPPGGELRASVKIRYRSEEAPALITPRPDGSVRVRFDEPQRSIAAGQWAVFYDGDLLLGGGVIESAL